ncbi:MAG TPA: hypothetical protein VHI52_10265 [Verrucomicrobiae bacterium]|nr:hypothetical protein [Verrucomicrobiae bacterium]
MNADKGFEMRGSSRVRQGFAAGSFAVRRWFVFPGCSFVFCWLPGSFRLFLFSCGLDFAEAVGGAVVSAVEAGFMPFDGFEGTRRMLESACGEHDPGGRFFVAGGGGLLTLLMGEGGGFKGPAAEKAPAADRHGFDEIVLVLGGRLESAGVGGEEGVKAVAGFTGEEDGTGEEAVGDGVLGGVPLAFRGAGASGFLSVGAVGGELGLG